MIECDEAMQGLSLSKPILSHAKNLTHRAHHNTCSSYPDHVQCLVCTCFAFALYLLCTCFASALHLLGACFVSNLHLLGMMAPFSALYRVQYTTLCSKTPLCLGGSDKGTWRRLTVASASARRVECSRSKSRRRLASSSSNPTTCFSLSSAAFSICTSAAFSICTSAAFSICTSAALSICHKVWP